MGIVTLEVRRIASRKLRRALFKRKKREQIPQRKLFDIQAGFIELDTSRLPCHAMSPTEPLFFCNY